MINHHFNAAFVTLIVLICTFVFAQSIPGANTSESGEHRIVQVEVDIEPVPPSLPSSSSPDTIKVLSPNESVPLPPQKTTPKAKPFSLHKPFPLKQPAKNSRESGFIFSPVPDSVLFGTNEPLFYDSETFEFGTTSSAPVALENITEHLTKPQPPTSSEPVTAKEKTAPRKRLKIKKKTSADTLTPPSTPHTPPPFDDASAQSDSGVYYDPVKSALLKAAAARAAAMRAAAAAYPAYDRLFCIAHESGFEYSLLAPKPPEISNARVVDEPEELRKIAKGKIHKLFKIKKPESKADSLRLSRSVPKDLGSKIERHEYLIEANFVTILSLPTSDFDIHPKSREPGPSEPGPSEPGSSQPGPSHAKNKSKSLEPVAGPRGYRVVRRYIPEYESSPDLTESDSYQPKGNSPSLTEVSQRTSVMTSEELITEGSSNSTEGESYELPHDSVKSKLEGKIEATTSKSYVSGGHDKGIEQGSESSRAVSEQPVGEVGMAKTNEPIKVDDKEDNDTKCDNGDTSSKITDKDKSTTE